MIPPPFPVEKFHGELFINSVSLHLPSWCFPDIRALYLPQDYRGENSLLPEVQPLHPNPYRVTQTTFTLQGKLTGLCDQNGDPYDDGQAVGWETNVLYLRENLLLPPAEPASTYDAYIELPSGSRLVADVQVGPLVFTDHLNEYDEVELSLRVPAGMFVPESS